MTDAINTADDDVPPGHANARPATERAFHELARPLLQVVHRVTGLETAFVTHIEWGSQQQEIVLASNLGDLHVPDGTSIDWADSLCRGVFLAGKLATDEVPVDFPTSPGAVVHGMNTFVAVPILAGDQTIGTLCGASRRSVRLDDDAVEIVQLLAQAMAQQLETVVEARSHRDRADRAERAAADADARSEAHATHAEEMRTLALVDDLTGLANRRAFVTRWEEELVRSARQQYDVALLRVDVDGFKAVNDGAGHAAGDDVLRFVADAITSCARTEDLAARLGGDEFALGISYTDGAGAMAVAERIRAAFAGAQAGAGPPCTVSIGVSASDSTPRAVLLAAADKALYRSKNGGRDQAHLWVGGVDDT